LAAGTLDVEVEPPAVLEVVAPVLPVGELVELVGAVVVVVPPDPAGVPAPPQAVSSKAPAPATTAKPPPRCRRRTDLCMFTLLRAGRALFA
jgi:hypothetical protein